VRLAAAVAVTVLLSACGGATAPKTGAADSGELQATMIASELVAGLQQRVPIGILDHNTPVTDASVRVRSFLLGSGDKAAFKGESQAPFKGDGLEGAGVYVAHLDLKPAGNWGLEVTASRPNGARLSQRLAINVVSKPLVPGVGEPAPASHNRTSRDQPDLTEIDSGRPPDDMHQVSIAEALRQHRPTLVVFASPAFCTSKVLQSLEPAYKDRLSFIHVEVYSNFKPDPSKRQLAPTVLEWRLQTEPWIFLIDQEGIIQSRFEGPTGTGELKTAVDNLLA